MHYPESSCLPEFPAIEREGWGLHDGGRGVNACCSYYSLVVRNPALWLVGSIHSGHYCSILDPIDETVTSGDITGISPAQPSRTDQSLQFKQEEGEDSWKRGTLPSITNRQLWSTLRAQPILVQTLPSGRIP